MIKNKILFGLALFVCFLFISPVLAQSETVTTDTPEVLTTDTVKNAVDVIGPWGLFWQGVKEQFALLTTLDPVTKIEKMTQFAQERMYMAEALAEKAENNEVLQKRAHQIMEKAEKFMQKVSDQKEKATKRETERAQKALQNAADQNMRRDEAIKRIEEKLSPENIQKLEEMRLRGLENSQRLINAIGNENISTTTKAHLEEVKSKIETHLQEVKTFLEEKKALLEKAQNGDEAAIEELRKMRTERNENRVENREKAKEIMEEKAEVRNEVRNQIREGRNATQTSE